MRLILDDPKGLAAVEARDRYNGADIIARHGATILQIILDLAPEFTMDMAYRALLIQPGRVGKLSAQTGKNHISKVITYVNASDLPYVIERTLKPQWNGAPRHYWSLRHCVAGSTD